MKNPAVIKRPKSPISQPRLKPPVGGNNKGNKPYLSHRRKLRRNML